MITLGNPVTLRDLEWEHYPENDLFPEHYSSVYGIVINVPGTSRWEAWVLNTVDGMPKCAEDIKLKLQLGQDYSVIQTAKRAVMEYMNRHGVQARGATA